MRKLRFSRQEVRRNDAASESSPSIFADVAALEKLFNCKIEERNLCSNICNSFKLRNTSYAGAGAWLAVRSIVGISVEVRVGRGRHIRLEGRMG